MELNDRRKDIVARAFAAIDPDDTAGVPLQVVLDRHNPSRHPRVTEGTLSENMAMRLLEQHMAAGGGEVVTLGVFAAYHVKMSMEVDRMRLQDKDAHFERLVTAMWDLDKDPQSALLPTNIYPITMGLPTGLAATRNMHLVWPDPNSEGDLVGFQGVVKPLFGRADLPASLQAYFAFPDEVARRKVSWVSGKATGLLEPLCVVWKDEDGLMVGLRGVVNNNVDRARLPPVLASNIMTDPDAAKIGVQLRRTEKAMNPVFKKSSESYGDKVETQSEFVMTMKRKAFEGTGVGQAWQGRVGKFTDEFKGGCFRNDSLNVTYRTQ